MQPQQQTTSAEGPNKAVQLMFLSGGLLLFFLVNWTGGGGGGDFVRYA